MLYIADHVSLISSPKINAADEFIQMLIEGLNYSCHRLGSRLRSKLALETIV